MSDNLCTSGKIWLIDSLLVFNAQNVSFFIYADSVQLGLPIALLLLIRLFLYILIKEVQQVIILAFLRQSYPFTHIDLTIRNKVNVFARFTLFVDPCIPDKIDSFELLAQLALFTAFQFVDFGYVTQKWHFFELDATDHILQDFFELLFREL